jgi:hypothetical protein
MLSWNCSAMPESEPHFEIQMMIVHFQHISTSALVKLSQQSLVKRIVGQPSLSHALRRLSISRATAPSTLLPMDKKWTYSHSTVNCLLSTMIRAGVTLKPDFHKLSTCTFHLMKRNRQEIFRREALSRFHVFIWLYIIEADLDLHFTEHLPPSITRPTWYSLPASIHPLSPDQFVGRFAEVVWVV